MKKQALDQVHSGEQEVYTDPGFAIQIVLSRILAAPSLVLAQTQGDPVMNLARIVASAMVFSSTCALAAGSGEVVQQGTSTKLVDACACQQPDHFDKSKMLTSVMISSKAIDPAKASSNCAQLRALLGKYVELDFAPDKSLDMIGIYDGEVGFSTGATDTLTLTRYDDKRIEGTYRTKDQAKKNSDGAYFDLTFAVDVPSAKH